jgi:hypothetical protein
MARVAWKDQPDAHDYPAASDYLSLLVADEQLRADLVVQLRAAPVLRYKAKDLLRASQLTLLTPDNVHVASDLRKIRKGRALSPVLLVRGDLLRGFPLQIADGYHRVCASYHVDENTDIPCRMIDLPSVSRVAAGASAGPSIVPAKKAAKKTPPAKQAPAKQAPAKKAPAKKAALATEADSPGGPATG